MCNCGNTTTSICTSTCTTADCACPIKDLSTDCVLYTGNDLACSGIKKGTILTELIQQLDTYICDKFSQTCCNDNLQKTLNYGAEEGTYEYTLSNLDNNYTIIIPDGDPTAVNINVPAILTSKINVGFVQQGNQVVTFVAGSGATINTPVGYTILGQHYWAYIEKIGSSSVYQLFGNLTF